MGRVQGAETVYLLVNLKLWECGEVTLTLELLW